MAGQRFYGTPPRATWLSFALRRYDRRAGRLPAEYDPEAIGAWSAAKRERYEAELLPAHFICPFERAGPRRENHLAGSTDMEVTGRHEAIQTWGWEDIVRGYPSPPAEYSVLTWNAVCAGGPAPLPDCAGPPTDPKVLVTYRNWKSPDIRRLRSSFSELTTAFCYQGEHMEYVYSQGGGRGEARKKDPGGTLEATIPAGAAAASRYLRTATWDGFPARASAGREGVGASMRLSPQLGRDADRRHD